MLRQHLCLVRAYSAAGLFTCLIFGATAFGEPDDPAPVAEPITQTVNVLAAKQAGDLAVEVRGHGQDKVRMVITNHSAKRLNVLLPAGLVAASATGQGGFQSMGLGTPSNEPGAFGAFRPAPTEVGLRSVAPSDTLRACTVTVPMGQKVEIAVPAVCLNFGLPTPTPRDKFQLMDVDDYSADPRVRKALRSLATLGTSHGVAQAAMWHVCNNVPFEFMAVQKSKIVNGHELALAAQFVAAVDASSATDLVEPSFLTEGRIIISVRGEGTLDRDAQRIEAALGGLRLMGLPVRVVDRDSADLPPAVAPALWVKVVLSTSTPGETRGRVFLERGLVDGGWVAFGKATFSEGSAANVLDPASLLKSLDRAIASTFVSVKAAGRGTERPTIKIDNHLPFTLASVVVKAGASSGQPKVELPALGIGPARSSVVPVPAPAVVVEHVELNGL